MDDREMYERRTRREAALGALMTPEQLELYLTNSHFRESASSVMHVAFLALEALEEEAGQVQARIDREIQALATAPFPVLATPPPFPDPGVTFPDPGVIR